jgi:hypothetical protein
MVGEQVLYQGVEQVHLFTLGSFVYTWLSELLTCHILGKTMYGGIFGRAWRLVHLGNMLLFLFSSSTDKTLFTLIKRILDIS